MAKSKKNDSDYINILLIGETGVGKSTFINSFANYLQYENLNAARHSKLICLIPTKFTITDEDGEPRLITFMKDKNEDAELGNSSTQAAKGYIFPFENKMIRLIDTPGNGDHRGLLQDRENFDDVLRYIGDFSHLHAICFFMKPDVTVINAYFKHCLIDLLSRLDKSAARNIMFIFTNTRGKNYSASDTLYNLKRLLLGIKAKVGVEIPLKPKNSDDSNVFCFDNEGFKYLVALQHNVEAGNQELMEQSWDISYEASWRLIRYILGDEKRPPLPPHKVRDTCSINEARRQIILMSKPLADISDLVQDNLTAIERHRQKVIQEDITKAELQDMLFLPVINIKQTVLIQPVTICAASKCSEIVTICGQKKYHYKQRCHNPCYLTNVPKEMINSSELRHCAAMRGNTCIQCGCDFSTHMHIYYETETYEDKIQDKTVQTQLETSAQIIKAQYDTIVKLQQRAAEYTTEHKEISLAMAKFAYFLMSNSICPYNDAYEEYLEFLIQREKVMGGDKNLIKRYEAIKKEHIEQKKILEESAKKSNEANITFVSSEEILSIKKKLYGLKHTGRLIQKLHDSLNAAQRKEKINSYDYIHNFKAKMPQVQTRPQKSEKMDDKQQIYKLLEADNYQEALKVLSQIEQEKAEKEKMASTSRNDELEEMKKMIAMLSELVTDKTKQKKEEINTASANKNQTSNVKNQQKKHNTNQNQRGPQGNQGKRGGYNNQGNKGRQNDRGNRGNNMQGSSKYNQNQHQFNQRPGLLGHLGHNLNQSNYGNQFPQNRGNLNQGFPLNMGNQMPQSFPLNMGNQMPQSFPHPGQFQQNYNQPTPFDASPLNFNQLQFHPNLSHMQYPQQSPIPPLMQLGQQQPSIPQMQLGQPQTPVNINLNISSDKPSTSKSSLESISKKYLDGPPTYDSVIKKDSTFNASANSTSSHNQSQSKGQGRSRGRRGDRTGPRGGRDGSQQQFKKPMQRKSFSPSNEDSNEDDDQSDTSTSTKGESQEIANMKQFLLEQRRIVQEKTAKRDSDEQKREENANARKPESTETINDMKKKLFNFFKNM